MNSQHFRSFRLTVFKLQIVSSTYNQFHYTFNKFLASTQSYKSKISKTFRNQVPNVHW